MTTPRFTPPPPFVVTGRCAESGCTVVVEGEVDLATSPAVERELDRHDHGDARPLEVDLTDVAFLDSTALNVLLRAKGRLLERGRALSVVAPGGPALRAIELTGLQHVLRVTSHR